MTENGVPTLEQELVAEQELPVDATVEAEASDPILETPEDATRNTKRMVMTGGASAAAVALAGAAAMLAMRKRSPNLVLDRGEKVSLSVVPRRAVWRYVRSLGLYEAQRRATRFTVTDKRLVIEDGVVKRAVSGIPLSAIQHVTLRTGPWEGSVDVAIPGPRGPIQSSIGPLRSPVARKLAAALAARGADVQEEAM